MRRSDPVHSKSRFGQAGPWLALAAWTLAIGAPISYFKASHMAALPVASSLIGSSNPASGWRLQHVLAAECSCSRRLADYLIQRGTLADTAENVLLIGADPALARQLEASGFRVDTEDAENLCAAYGSEAAPFLQIVDVNGSLRYSGSYFPRFGDQTRQADDLELLAEARAGRFTPSRPVTGCPTSQRLKSAIDPFHLRFKKAAIAP